MESHAAIRIAPANEADSPLRSEETDVASALALLRQPGPVASILALAFVLSGVAFLRIGWTPRLWLLVPLLMALAVNIVLDLRAKIIPDIVTLPGIVYALALAAVAGGLPLLDAVLGALAGGGLLLLLALVSHGAVGGGDIKLMAMLGAALGWRSALAVLAFSQVTAALFAVVLLIARRAGRRDVLPVGALISLFGALALLGAH